MRNFGQDLHTSLVILKEKHGNNAAAVNTLIMIACCIDKIIHRTPNLNIDLFLFICGCLLWLLFVMSMTLLPLLCGNLFVTMVGALTKGWSLWRTRDLFCSCFSLLPCQGLFFFWPVFELCVQLWGHTLHLCPFLQQRGLQLLLGQLHKQLSQIAATRYINCMLPSTWWPPYPEFW